MARWGQPPLVYPDQRLIRGIGNSYADEILYHASIPPFSITSAIPVKQAKVLFKRNEKVLNQAIEKIAKENGDEVKAKRIGGCKSYYTDRQEIFG